ncbi:EamA domain-containing membrane protein RarD [Chitinophaga jiangningensis]|uniref:EamA domain-containing membrane protein RarD n=1 Tax=Chitinophaga jiangningensis TaxID=1419482 RepID=A0A1M6Y4B1_9BACT|nr:DMT family transporter [Chitinophaga jiangningensis]SHL13110.1 EamA domain-containing membrane protein RarD [Chitinophaga jiangningensis]
MKKSFLLLHIAVILAGFTGIFGKLISINEIGLVWFRALFSMILLYLILKGSRKFMVYERKQQWQLMASGLLPGLHWLLFYASIKYSNISIGVICFCTSGFFTALLGPVVAGKRFSARELLLSLLTVIGVGLIFHFDTSYRLGITLGLISSVFGSLYMLTNEKLIRRYDAAMINYYQMAGITLGIGLLIPVYVYTLPIAVKLIPTGTDIGYLLILASFCTIAIYVMVAESLRRISAFTVSLSFNLEPVYSILLAILFFQEGKQLNMAFYTGLLLIITSVLLQMFMSIKTSKIK